jgi:type IV pilus assembly protein PilB
MKETTDYIPLSLELQQVITTEQAWHYSVVPKANNSTLELYIDEQRINDNLQAELEILLGKPVSLESTSPIVIQKTLGKYYRKNTSQGISRESKVFNRKNEDFLQTLISEAKSLGSSDIHIESYEEKGRVRIRIDGRLIERYTISQDDYPIVVNKIKIKANLDIAEKRLPQDGRIMFSADGHKFDIRVSVLPTLHGEKIVLRLLSNDATDIDIKKLGFSERQLEDYLEGIKRPHGIVLISGPTGSGKTTTLYATLKILNKKTTNILTIEDPVEYTLEGINQVQLKESIGLTFASTLRTFLRQDPDIIMVGEIRDVETAKMAFRAALTGHLVLSTIHTNSAWGIVSRLKDMDIPPYLIAGTLNTAAAQRLVRLLCPECKNEEAFDSKLFPRTFIPAFDLHTHSTAVGCDHCHYTGYKSRRAIYEIIPMDHDLSEMIKSGNFNVGDALKEKNIQTLSNSAFELFAEGLTSLEEVYPILLNT